MTRLMTSVFVDLATVVIMSTVAAQENGWSVPEDARAMKNPVAATADTVQAGRELYNKNCQKCHGDAGLGDGPATRFIRPAPKEIASAATQDRMTDGEIFYKITEGKKPMPPMKTALTAEQRWQIVHFVRTLRQP